jgi:hypothetical protein
MPLKRVLVLAALALLAFALLQDRGAWLPGIQEQAPDAPGLLQRAYQDRQSDVQVQGEGVVVRVLPDDLEGSRHQRFILRLDSGQTLLISHNIDLAPRIEGLAAGDSVAFHGEYEWNEKGGVVHWTHRDPNGRHPDGWLRHGGRTYW